MAKRSSGVGWLIAGMTLLFGGVVLAAERSKTKTAPPSEDNGPIPVPAERNNSQRRETITSPDARSDRDANDLLKETQPEAPRFSWTLASVALVGEDTYNIEAERKARKIRLANQSGAKLVNAFQQLVYFIANLAYPGAGAALQAVFTGISVIGESVVTSRGGFNNLSQLTRKRLQLYGNIVVASQSLPGVEAKTIGRFPEQSRETPRYVDQRTIEHYRKLITWYRANLEFQRILATPDEPIFPIAYISFLQTEKLWPPPIEPIELSSARSSAEYARWPSVLNWIRLNPIEAYVTDKETALRAFELLRAEYSTRNPDYQELVLSLSLSPEVAQSMSENGSLPRLGSALFPIAAEPSTAAAGM